MNDREPGKPTVFSELKRRNVVRAIVLYAGAVWVISQGIAQLSPALGLPDWATRGFLLAAALGLPFWIAFAWIYELTPQGIRREGTVPVDQSITRRTGRKLDFAIIAVLAVAVLLLLGNQFLWHKGVGPAAPPVSAVAAASAAPAASVVPVMPADIPEKSVAVLPFTNESGQADQQYFSDGLSEDLITALSQFNGLKVISRNSAFQFRDSKDTSAQIGKLLGVAHLLEGSVQRAGDEVRITATLVNASDGTVLWTQRYDRPYKDLFALQDAITRSVADALKAKLLTAPGAVVQSDRPPSGDLGAYTAYLRGVAGYARLDEPGIRQAIDDFQRAVAIDPHYATAWAALSRAWARLGAAYLGGTAKQQAYAQARQAVDQALHIEPELAAAHNARSYYQAYVESDWNGAKAEIQRALQLAPNDGDAKYLYGSLLATLGQCRRATDFVQQALVTDPRNGGWYYALSQYLACDGRMADAEQAIQTALAFQPEGSSNHEWLAILAILRGDAKAALAAAQQEPPGPWHDIAVALALQIGPDRKAADIALENLITQYAGTGPYQIAEVYAIRKDPDNMFKWLDRAWTDHDPGVSNLLYDPLILRYRHDPRFAAFCRKVGLPATSDAVAMK